MAGVLAAFWALDAGRSANGFGPNPLAWSDIEAWSRLTETALDGWEIDALRRMDSIRLTKAAVKQPELPKFDRGARRELMPGKKS